MKRKKNITRIKRERHNLFITAREIAALKTSIIETINDKLD
jgi:hypothetical protein